ncbi:MAG: cation-translocating P-type ATPase [Campylobacterota bacterium]|nr:cation-translocating P-type ATPase [Campylobacterota bacterium]
MSLLSEYIFYLPHIFFTVFSLTSLSLTAIPIIINSIRGLLRGEPNVDELVSLAIIAMIGMGKYTPAAMVAFIMTLGSLLEEHAAGRARSNIETIAAQHPTHAIILRDNRFVEIPLEQVAIGNHILVRPGDIVPVDGKIINGESSIDESSLTGESMPVEKSPGNMAYAGTTNQNGVLQIEALRIGENSTYGKIVSLIKEAENQRIPTRRIIDKFIKYYTPIILIATGVVWFITGENIYRAITVLVVSCPCALILASPVSTIAALSSAARLGILIKGGRYLETCADIDKVVFDKTGTLTTGEPRIKRIIPLNGNKKNEILQWAAKAEAGSEHPIAKAVLSFARKEGIDVNFKGRTHSHIGFGVESFQSNQHIAVGSERFFKQISIPISEDAKNSELSILDAGEAPLFVSKDNEIIGLIIIEDCIRPESLKIVENLKKTGIDRIAIFTGDTKTVACSVAKQCKVPLDAVYAELLPDQKQNYLRIFQDSGEKVCYIGDGTNDGPALAQANVGMSIGSRENTIALETADIVFMRQGLEHLPFVLKLGKNTKKTININLFFATSFNFTMIILAALGILTPVLGAIGHNIGSLTVVLNSIRLTRFNKKKA